MQLLDWKKNSNTKLDHLAEIVYLLMFNMMLGIKMAGFYDGQMIFKLVFVVYVLLFFIKMILTQYTMKEYLLSALLIILSGLVYINTGEKGLFLCFSMMLGVKNVSVKKVISIAAIISGLTMTFNIFTRAFGLIGEAYYSSYREGIGEQIRHTLGYAHPNTLSISFFVLTIILVYLSTKKRFHIYFVSMIFLALNLYIFMYSGSRTGLLCSIIYILINLYFYNKKGLKISEKIMCTLIYPTTSIVTIVLPFILHGDVFTVIDNYVFSLRLTMAKYYAENNELSLFGIRLANPDELPFSIDMAGMYLFLQLGLAAFIIVVALNLIFVKRAIKMGMMAELAMFIAICFAGIWEPFLYNSSYKNLIFLFIGVIVFSNDPDKLNFDNSSHDVNKSRIYMGFLAGIIVAFIVTIFFLFTTKPYSVLYADIEAPNVERNMTQSKEYLNQEMQEQIIENGGIILRWWNKNDLNAPLYKYDNRAAISEYWLKTISIFVFCFVFCISLESLYFVLRDWKRTNSINGYFEK